MVGGLIGIKPMIYLDDNGKLEVCGKIRGRKKALNALAETTLAQITDRDTPVRISHGDCIEDAQYVAAQLEAAGLKTEVRMIDTVIGSHTAGRHDYVLCRQRACAVLSGHWQGRRPAPRAPLKRLEPNFTEQAKIPCRE